MIDKSFFVRCSLIFAVILVKYFNEIRETLINSLESPKGIAIAVLKGFDAADEQISQNHGRLINQCFLRQSMTEKDLSSTVTEFIKQVY